jgi:hypothetical protein
MNDLFHWLLATFVLTPFQAEIDRKLEAANASRATIEQVQTCMTAAAPALTERATADWVWGARTIIGVATGLNRPEQVLADEIPACRPAIESIRPLLQATSS